MSKKDVYELGDNLGLNRTDIDNVLRDISNIKEEQSFVMSYPTYAGLNYGTISIKDF
jgi:hypothetical protein